MGHGQDEGAILPNDTTNLSKVLVVNRTTSDDDHARLSVDV